MESKKKVIDPAPIIEKLAARCLETKGLECSVLGNVIDMLRAAPSADAVEVVHGRWEKQGKHEWVCSACKIGVPYSYTGFHYCPNCGADMRGDGNA